MEGLLGAARVSLHYSPATAMEDVQQALRLDQET